MRVSFLLACFWVIGFGSSDSSARINWDSGSFSDIEVCGTWDDGKIARVFLCDGRVVKAATREQFLSFQRAEQLRHPVQVRTDIQNNVRSLRVQENEVLPDANEVGMDSEMDFAGFAPSTIPLTQIRNLWNSMNRSWRLRSQCYQRAMVWTYEANQTFGYKSQKAFLFFTQKYISEYDYHWWFHVAPMFRFSRPAANGSTELLDLVLDRSYFEGGLMIKDWTDSFVKSAQTCPVVSKYSDYSKNQWTRHCYLMIMPMYFYQPMDLEANEHNPVEMTGFRGMNVDHAYRGFRRRGI